MTQPLQLISIFFKLFTIYLNTLHFLNHPHMYMYLRLTSTEENFKNGGGEEGYKHILLCLSSWLSPCPLIVISFSGSDAIVFVYYAMLLCIYAWNEIHLLDTCRCAFTPTYYHGGGGTGQFMCTCKSIQVNKDWVYIVA